MHVGEEEREAMRRADYVERKSQRQRARESGRSRFCFLSLLYLVAMVCQFNVISALLDAAKRLVTPCNACCFVVKCLVTPFSACSPSNVV